MLAPSDSVTNELAAEGPVEKTDRRNEICDIDYPYVRFFTASYAACDLTALLLNNDA
jgi:hypothetical protein